MATQFTFLKSSLVFVIMAPIQTPILSGSCYEDTQEMDPKFKETPRFPHFGKIAAKAKLNATTAVPTCVSEAFDCPSPIGFTPLQVRSNGFPIGPYKTSRFPLKGSFKGDIGPYKSSGY